MLHSMLNPLGMKHLEVVININQRLWCVRIQFSVAALVRQNSGAALVLNRCSLRPKVSDVLYIVTCKIVLLDFVDRLNYEITAFRKLWILRLAPGEKVKRTENLSVGLLG
jgi:hypothetical protein